MINQLSMWQMVVDLCLVSSILLMAFRTAKASRSQALMSQVSELETRVSRLINEADAVAKGIHDQLIRREQNISKYISDLEEREKSITTGVVESESLTKELSLLCETARRESRELSQALSDIARKRTDSVSAPEPRSAPRSREFFSTEDSDDSFREERVQFSTRTPSRRAAEWLDVEEQKPVAQPAAPTERSPLQRLNDLYQTAEDMLKNGRKPREVSERTRIPMDGIERLAQMIEIEREETKEKERTAIMRSESDVRLGVLGVPRRPTSTL